MRFGKLSATQVLMQIAIVHAPNCAATSQQ